jgi:hypothetical protein
MATAADNPQSGKPFQFGLRSILIVTALVAISAATFQYGVVIGISATCFVADVSILLTGSTTLTDWRKVRNCFVITFTGSLLFGAPLYFTVKLPDVKEEVFIAGFLWSVGAVFALRPMPFRGAFAVAAGLVWGFLLSMSAAISIQNGRVSVCWPAMIPVLLGPLPLAFTITLLPIWFLSRRDTDDAS